MVPDRGVRRAIAGKPSLPGRARSYDSHPRQDPERMLCQSVRHAISEGTRATMLASIFAQIDARQSNRRSRNDHMAVGRDTISNGLVHRRKPSGRKKSIDAVAPFVSPIHSPSSHQLSCCSSNRRRRQCSVGTANEKIRQRNGEDPRRGIAMAFIEPYPRTWAPHPGCPSRSIAGYHFQSDAFVRLPSRFD